MEEAREISHRAYLLLSETYKEECTDDESGPSHVDLIKRLLVRGGVDPTTLDQTPMTPGNSAAIALYKEIGDRGPLYHMIGAGAVEYYYSELSPKIFEAYTTIYGMDSDQAETYQLHGPMDKEHAERALSLVDDPLVYNDAGEVLRAVRDAFVATSLHYDGMLQAATGTIQYWSGR
ncbi:iron-containing redox enzyme family protein [Methylobacterium sp. J-070]|uniref:iron-containing redox enzyme family protein n=1 Tax=Methylobacterium sp. J-070 TaxID=2836650 RepID=UPI001FB8A30A|nr:iron-containing redox enzyme family protein [Methylobacterium sp. J-070]MCJ2054456.1 iron-containing redox enzyme family protein [Methylobacterium sp. J-070]